MQKKIAHCAKSSKITFFHASLGTAMLELVKRLPLQVKLSTSHAEKFDGITTMSSEVYLMVGFGPIIDSIVVLVVR